MQMRAAWRCLPLAGLALLVTAAGAHAADTSMIGGQATAYTGGRMSGGHFDNERSWSFTVSGARWAHENLVNIPVEQVTGRLQWWDQYFVGIGVSKTLVSGLPFGNFSLLSNSRLELEGQYLRHFGRMDYGEAVAALVWRTPDLALPGDFTINGGFGAGLSYTFTTPLLETIRRNRTAQKLLVYLGFEMEITHASMPNVSIVPRLHHRSGMYGMVGPRGDGSNYIGLGLRFKIP